MWQWLNITVLLSEGAVSKTDDSCKFSCAENESDPENFPLEFLSIRG